MDKKVILVLDYENAPDTLKAATTAYGQAEKKLALEESKLATATKAVADAKAKVLETEKAFNAEFNAWTPTTGV